MNFDSSKNVNLLYSGRLRGAVEVAPFHFHVTLGCPDWLLEACSRPPTSPFFTRERGLALSPTAKLVNYGQLESDSEARKLAVLEHLVVSLFADMDEERQYHEPVKLFWIG